MTPIIVRLLGLESFGAWNQAMVIAYLLSSFTVCGMKSSLVRFYFEYKKQNRQGDLLLQALTPVIVVSLPLSIIMCVWSEKISEVFLQTREYASIFKYSSVLIVVISLYDILLNYIRAQDRVKLYSLIDASLIWVELIIAILVLFVKKDIILLLLFSILCHILAILTTVSLIIKDVISSINLQWNGIGKLLKFGLPLLPSQLSSNFSARGDRLIIGYFLGAQAVGIYSTCYVAASAIALFSLPVVTSLPPKLARLWDSGENEKVYNVVCSSTMWVLGFSLASLVGLQTLGVEAITIITKANMSDSSNLMLLLIGVGVVAFSLSRTINMIQHAKKNTKVLGSLWIGASLINLIANIILVPRIGIVGAALATLFSYMFLLIMSLCLIGRDVKLLFQWQFYLKLTISLLMLWIVTNFYTVSSLKELILALAIGSFVFIISFLAMRPFITKAEEKIFKNLWNRLLFKTTKIGLDN